MYVQQNPTDKKPAQVTQQYENRARAGSAKRRQKFRHGTPPAKHIYTRTNKYSVGLSVLLDQVQTGYRTIKGHTEQSNGVAIIACT